MPRRIGIAVARRGHEPPVDRSIDFGRGSRCRRRAYARRGMAEGRHAAACRPSCTTSRTGAAPRATGSSTSRCSRSRSPSARSSSARRGPITARSGSSSTSPWARSRCSRCGSGAAGPIGVLAFAMLASTVSGFAAGAGVVALFNAVIRVPRRPVPAARSPSASPSVVVFPLLYPSRRLVPLRGRLRRAPDERRDRLGPVRARAAPARALAARARRAARGRAAAARRAGARGRAAADRARDARRARAPRLAAQPARGRARVPARRVRRRRSPRPPA